MNRREAIAALVSLPAVTRISVAQVTPKDVIVVECDKTLSMATAEHFRQQLQRIWPDHKIVVLGDGLKFKLVEGS